MRLLYQCWHCKTKPTNKGVLVLIIFVQRENENQHLDVLNTVSNVDYFFCWSIVAVVSNWTKADGQYRFIFDICRFCDVDESSVDKSVGRFLRLLAARSGFDASNIGWRIRRRALINQLFTCNRERFVFCEIARFSSSVGYGWTWVKKKSNENEIDVWTNKGKILQCVEKANCA